jgi:hypothetical protein
MPAVDDDGAGSGGRRPKAWIGGNRGEGYEGPCSGLYRMAATLELASIGTTTFTFWHDCCGGVKATLPSVAISNSYALQKDHTFQLLR